MRPATDEPASDDDIGFHPVGDVERRELGQMDGRGDPDDAVNVVLVGAVDRDLVAPVPAGPDPVVRDEVADPERQPERDEVRDEVMDPADLGQDVEDREADDLGRQVEEVEREVAPEEVAPDLASAEDPQLDQDEVGEGRDLRRQERRDQQLLLPHHGDEGVQRDLVDDDARDPDKRELRGTEEGAEEATDPRPAVPACGALGVRLGLRHCSLGAVGGPPHRSRAPNGASNRPGRNETPEGTNRSAGPFPPMQAPATRFLRTPVRSRHRRCKHLRPRFRSVMAPSGRTNSTGAMAGLAMGLSTNFGPNRRIRSALSTVRPRSRWRTGRGGWSRRGVNARLGVARRRSIGRCPAPGASAERSRGPDMEMPGGTVDPRPSPPEQAPAVSRLRPIGPFGQNPL